jgi:hypothetical protein
MAGHSVNGGLGAAEAVPVATNQKPATAPTIAASRTVLLRRSRFTASYPPSMRPSGSTAGFLRSATVFDRKDQPAHPPNEGQMSDPSRVRAQLTMAESHLALAAPTKKPGKGVISPSERECPV